MVLEQLIIGVGEKMNLDLYLTDTEIKSKWIEDLNVRAKIIKLTEEAQKKSLWYWIKSNMLCKYDAIKETKKEKAG